MKQEASTLEYNKKSKYRFIIMSLIGVLFFLTPIPRDGSFTILMALLVDEAKNLLSPILPELVLGIIAISVIFTLYFSFIRSSEKGASPFKEIFQVNHGTVGLRLAGLIVAFLIYFEFGPEWIWHADTGGVVFYSLATSLVALFLFATILLPFLTDFGLMEFFGTILNRPFQKMFKIPGRASIDTLASWLTAAVVGILITSQQYKKGNYNKKEAYIIVTNFSIVSVPFTYLVADFAGMSAHFFPFYLSVILCGVIAAMIMARIPPLSQVPEEYVVASQDRKSHREDENLSFKETFGVAFEKAVDKAGNAPSAMAMMRQSIINTFDIWFGLLPALMFIATLGLVLAEYTPIFNWLALPLEPLLHLLQLPEASSAAPAFVVGFAEMFLPAVIAQGIESELTRFVIITVSITQLIYMSEVGVMLLKCPIPIKFHTIVTIFIMRTLITLPIAAGIAHIVF